MWRRYSSREPTLVFSNKTSLQEQESASRSTGTKTPVEQGVKIGQERFASVSESKNVFEAKASHTAGKTPQASPSYGSASSNLQSMKSFETKTQQEISDSKAVKHVTQVAAEMITKSSTADIQSSYISGNKGVNQKAFVSQKIHEGQQSRQQSNSSTAEPTATPTNLGNRSYMVAQSTLTPTFTDANNNANNVHHVNRDSIVGKSAQTKTPIVSIIDTGNNNIRGESHTNRNVATASKGSDDAGVKSKPIGSLIVDSPITKPPLHNTEVDIQSKNEQFTSFRVYRGRVYEVTNDSSPSGVDAKLLPHAVNNDVPTSSKGIIRSTSPERYKSKMYKPEIIVSKTTDNIFVSSNQTNSSKDNKAFSVFNQGTSSTGSNTLPHTSKIQSHTSRHNDQQTYSTMPTPQKPTQLQQQQMKNIFRDNQRQLQESKLRGQQQFPSPQNQQQSRAVTSKSANATSNRNSSSSASTSLIRDSSKQSNPPQIRFSSVGTAQVTPPSVSSNKAGLAVTPISKNSNVPENAMNGQPLKPSSYRLDQKSLLSKSLSVPSSATSQPKSILKNTSQDGTPDRNRLQSYPPPSQPQKSPGTLHIPRVDLHTDRGSNATGYAKNNFDFSSILTNRPETFLLGASSQGVRVGGVNKVQDTGSQVPTPLKGSQRPVSAGAINLRYELEGKDAQPSKKSVTFNNQVRLHMDNRVSTIKNLAVDA